MPSEYDPVALRELFSPGFLGWVTTMSGEIDFGINDRQLWFLWRLRERSEEELKAALKNAGQLFRGCRAEMDESGIHTYPPGPWHAGPGAVPGRLGACAQARVVGVAGEDDAVVLRRADRPSAGSARRSRSRWRRERLVGGARRAASDSSCLIVGKASGSSPAALRLERRRAARTSAASVVSTPSGFGGVWAGARARKNQASKRVETTSGVIQRENRTSSSSAGSSIPASSASSRTAQAR